ncbi:MAG: glycine cleavage system aminomethyltransferase GcvT [Phycisphaerales bacterium]|nr:glycine cleavage system aminomethyltransferase GcvT [Phycisphaerales bacterium]
MPLRTPLHKFHLEHGGKMVDFAGWEMPLYYQQPGADPSTQGIIAEHKQVRTSGGFFDVSHMGRVKVQGRHARRFLERLCTRKIFDMEPGQVRYSLVCNDAGGVKDDILVYRLDDDDFYLVVNASNREKLLAHFDQVRAGLGADAIVKIEDVTMKTAMVAIQGPKVMEVISNFSREIPTLKRYRFVEKNYLIMKLMVSRTGYTGEDGVEVILPAMAVEMAMKMLLKDMAAKSPESIVKPAGLGARDTLRTEAGMPLYGHELREEWPALTAGVDFAIALDKHEHERGEKFVGQDALLRLKADGGPKRRITGILIEGKRAARQGMAVLVNGSPAGEVTSGCTGPTLDRVIAHAMLDASIAPGTKVDIDTGKGAMLGGVVQALPFYKMPK